MKRTYSYCGSAHINYDGIVAVKTTQRSVRIVPIHGGLGLDLLVVTSAFLPKEYYHIITYDESLLHFEVKESYPDERYKTLDYDTTKRLVEDGAEFKYYLDKDMPRRLKGYDREYVYFHNKPIPYSYEALAHFFTYILPDTCEMLPCIMK